MADQIETQVLIAGGGPVGLTLTFVAEMRNHQA
jgi:thioredoxin reductase